MDDELRVCKVCRHYQYNTHTCLYHCHNERSEQFGEPMAAEDFCDEHEFEDPPDYQDEPDDFNERRWMED